VAQVLAAHRWAGAGRPQPARDGHAGRAQRARAGRVQQSHRESAKGVVATGGWRGGLISFRFRLYVFSQSVSTTFFSSVCPQICVLKVNIHCDGCLKKVKVLHKIDDKLQDQERSF
jgi:hypothetical protein